MEDKIKKAFLVCLILLLVSVVTNIVLSCRLQSLSKEKEKEKTEIPKEVSPQGNTISEN